MVVDGRVIYASRWTNAFPRDVKLALLKGLIVAVVFVVALWIFDLLWVLYYMW